MAKASHVQRALDVFGDELMGKKNVVGIGRVPAESGAAGEWELAVYVEERLPVSSLEGDDLVPEVLELPGRGKVRITTQVIEQGPVSLETPPLGKEPLGKEPP